MAKRSTLPKPRQMSARPNPLADLTRVDDYLEVVYDLIRQKGYARPSDIAERLGVRTASVTGMLQRLHHMGLIVYERYRGLTLTPDGQRRAKTIQQTHRTILKFLNVFGIEEEIAKEDAEGIEHHLHKATIERIASFVDFVDKHPEWFRTFIAAVE